jgi:hypothetical protein
MYVQSSVKLMATLSAIGLYGYVSADLLMAMIAYSS